MVRQRVRVRFTKQGDLRWIGHRDLMRCCERLFRRAGLPLSFSEGFHPKPRMTFPLALAVGMAAADEPLEFELSAPCTAAELQDRLAAHAPPGLGIRSVAVLPPGSPKARVRSVTYTAAIPPRRQPLLAERIAALADQAAWPVVRRGTSVDLRPLVQSLAFCDGVLSLRFAVGEGPGAGPRDLLALLDLPELEAEGVVWQRTVVEVDG